MVNIGISVIFIFLLIITFCGDYSKCRPDGTQKKVRSYHFYPYVVPKGTKRLVRVGITCPRFIGIGNILTDSVFQESRRDGILPFTAICYNQFF